MMLPAKRLSMVGWAKANCGASTQHNYDTSGAADGKHDRGREQRHGRRIIVCWNESGTGRGMSNVISGSVVPMESFSVLLLTGDRVSQRHIFETGGRGEDLRGKERAQPMDGGQACSGGMGWVAEPNCTSRTCREEIYLTHIHVLFLPTTRMSVHFVTMPRAISTRTPYWAAR